MEKDKKASFKEKALKAIGVDGWSALLKVYKFVEGEPDQVQMIDASLADGTKITIDKMEVGGRLMIVTEQGEIPAPTGDHTLTDGTIIKCEDGVITEIVAASPAPEQEMAADSPEKMMDDKINALYEKIKAELAPKEEKKEEMAEEDKEKKEKEEEMAATIKAQAEEMASVKSAFSSVVKLVEALMEDKASVDTSAPNVQTFGKKEKVAKLNAVQAELAKYK